MYSALGLPLLPTAIIHSPVHDAMSYCIAAWPSPRPREERRLKRNARPATCRSRVSSFEYHLSSLEFGNAPHVGGCDAARSASPGCAILRTTEGRGHQLSWDTLASVSIRTQLDGRPFPSSALEIIAPMDISVSRSGSIQTILRSVCTP